ncbi:Prefoldin subunit-domain-containing protein [Rhodotorula diobovata]|uniref:Prefoldin subunit 3 n=1 Tax=Rhodotorula diobovata TaxID=5288 RepID=A0A5C5FV51_9BASI|nr:Prefoldin subunit-domain-containing protein [Rhodotorula diobovata]
MSTSNAPAPPAPKTVKPEETNPRGVPKAVFLEDVTEFVGGPEGDAEVALKTLQDTLAKYKFMEQSSLQRRAGLEDKVPELERTIEMVDLLIRKKEQSEPFETTFELADTLYAKGEVEEVEEVYIWLGASTMLSYPLSDAHALLTSKLTSARTSLSTVKEDLAFLRDQITVTEVNVARVYNWDVARRRERRLRGEEEEGGPGGKGKKGEDDDEAED